MRYDELVQVRAEELRAEAAANRAVRQAQAVRRAERRYRKAKRRLVAVRVHASYAG